MAIRASGARYVVSAARHSVDTSYRGAKSIVARNFIAAYPADAATEYLDGGEGMTGIVIFVQRGRCRTNWQTKPWRRSSGTELKTTSLTASHSKPLKMRHHD